MYFVSADSEITDASLNIALETYLVDEPILLFKLIHRPLLQHNVFL